MKKGKKQETLVNLLFEALEKANIGTIEQDSFEGEDCRWIDLKIKRGSLCITFNEEGTKITDIALYKDIYEVVDQKKVWGN